MPDLAWEAVAAACRVPPQNVCVAWPLIVEALAERGMRSLPVQVAAAATVAVETGDFMPKRERRANAIRQTALYKAQERYWPSGFYGRGYIQLTWEDNYRLYGQMIGEDLVSAPDRALEPGVAARLLAAYFATRHVVPAAEAGDWPKVRRLVNGGTNGLTEFLDYVRALTPAGG